MQKYIDLSQKLLLDNKTYPTYPGQQDYDPVFKQIKNITQNNYTEYRMTMNYHTGTHMDAPHHIVENGRTLDDFSLDKFIGNALVIQCTVNEGKHEIEPSDIDGFKKEIQKVDFVLFNTGWSKKWKEGKSGSYYRTPSPSLSADSIDWIVKNCAHLKGVGLDFSSPDKVVPIGATGAYPYTEHKALLEKEILVIENLTNLDSLPIKEHFIFQCLPLSIEKAPGCPVRAIAILYKD